jgi:5'(3')-deoxyribonucleotidase
LDGVIYRWQDTAIYLLNTFRGTKISYEAWNRWDYLKETISDADWKWLWKEGVEEYGLFRYGSIYKGSQQFLKEMEPICDNVIITSRPGSAVQTTMEWLSYQRIPTTEVHIVGHTQLKSQIQPYCDIVIDDAEHNAKDILANTPSVVIMPARPWNLGFNPGKAFMRFHRLETWAEIEHALAVHFNMINGALVNSWDEHR